MSRSPAVKPVGTRAPPRLRLVLLGMLIVTAVATSLWRTAAGHAVLPGMFTVVFLPLSLVLFVALDRIAGFGPTAWVAAASLVALHLVLSVPGAGGPLYYRGTHLIRPDHFVHLFAGGLVAWLAADVVRQVRPAAHKSLWAVAAFGLAIAFGTMKETTDFLSLQASNHSHDTFDSIVDVCANAIGAGAALWWLAASSRERRPA
jgi:hypothetical protein